MIATGRPDFESYIEEYCSVCLRSGKGRTKFITYLDHCTRKWTSGLDKRGLAFGFKTRESLYTSDCWGFVGVV